MQKTNTTTDKLLLLLLIASVFGNAWQATKLRSHQLTHQRSTAADLVGEKIDRIDLTSRSGGPVALDFPRDRPVTLYVVRPDCIWCERNLPSAQSLSDAIEETHDFVVVERSTPLEFAAEEFEKYRSLSDRLHGEAGPFTLPASSFSERISGTPWTLVIGESGEVTAGWSGAYVDHNEKPIRDYFGVEFESTMAPDLSSKPIDLPRTEGDLSASCPDCFTPDTE